MKNRTVDVSIILYVKLLNGNATKSYLLDSGIQGDLKDRISVYIKDELLYFSVTDRIGEEHFATISITGLENSFHMLVFELTTIENTSAISIYSGLEKVAFSEAPFPLIFTNNPIEENYFVGADRTGKHASECEIAEQLIYLKTLSNEEKSIAFDYLTKKHQNSPRTSMLFTKGAFLYRNKNSTTLIQPDVRLRPQYTNAGVI